ncbi:MAG TPA: RNA polymerase sigma factor [Phycisphaerales bacterium]|nr:RNA polymerase sigma factor [Phycisphaerales bacterium]HMP37297.1 RNA polymerase sigma factor [Phycisphaerales bacterium]
MSLTEANLRRWMDRLGPSMMALSYGICRDRHRAEEIVQEAFVRLWKDPPDAGEVAFGAWLRKVVTNLSINCLTRTRRPAALPEGGNDGGLSDQRPGPLRSLESIDARTRLEAALDRLDEHKRAILLLRGAEQLSYEAIAEHLGVPIGTVMSRLNRARAALMEELDRIDRGEDAADRVFDIRRYRHA